MITNRIKPPSNVKPIDPKTHTLPMVKSKGKVHLLTRKTLAKASVFKRNIDKRNVKKYKFL